LRKINIHRLTFGGQVAKSIRTLELNFNFLSSVLQMTLRQDRKKGQVRQAVWRQGCWQEGWYEQIFVRGNGWDVASAASVCL